MPSITNSSFIKSLFEVALLNQLQREYKIMGRLTRHTDMELIRFIDTIENELYYIALGKIDDTNEDELEHDLSELKLELTTRHPSYS